MQQIVDTLIRNGLFEVRLDGPSFRGSGGMQRDDYPIYKSHGRDALLKMANYFRSLGPGRELYESMYDKVTLSDRKGNNMTEEVLAFIPRANGPLYMQALEAIASDIARDTGLNVRRIENQVSYISLRCGELSFPETRIKQTDQVKDFVRGLQRLEKRAFTFGREGGVVYVTLHLTSGKKERIRLRPKLCKRSELTNLSTSPLPPILVNILLTTQNIQYL